MNVTEKIIPSFPFLLLLLLDYRIHHGKQGLILGSLSLIFWVFFSLFHDMECSFLTVLDTIKFRAAWWLIGSNKFMGISISDLCRD